jgi:hypothetical protein
MKRKIIVIFAGLLTLVGSQVFASKKLHVLNLQAGAIYESLVAAGTKVTDGVLDIGGINCAVVKEGVRDKFVTTFSCSINTANSHETQRIEGSKASDVITALNRAGVHSSGTRILPETFIKFLFVQSLSCEKTEQTSKDNTDLTPDAFPLYACSLEI